MSKKNRKKKPLYPEVDARPTWLSRHAWILLWAGIAAYAFFFGGFSIFRYRNFSYADWDLATYNQIFRTFLSGHSYTSLLDLPYLGVHCEGTMLVFLPIYLIFPHPATLLVLQSFVMALAAFPLYMIARTVFQESVCLLFVVLYFFYPAFWYVNLNEFHPECLMPLLQFFLFYFFLKKDFGKFLVFMFLCLFAKENMPLIVMMFGILSLIQRRSKRWLFWPICAGMIWFGFYLKVLKPWLNPGLLKFDYLYNHMGNSLPAIAWFIIAHPIQTFSLFIQSQHLTYARYIFSPLLFMSFLSPGVLLLSLPIFLQHFLSARATETNLYYYYAAEFSAIVFIAALFGLNRLRRFLSPRRNWIFYFFAAASVFLTVRVLFEANLFPRIERWMRADEVRARSYTALLGAVPRDAASLATFSFLPELSRRPGHLYSFHGIMGGSYYPGRPFTLPAECSYAFIDYEDPLTFDNFFSSPVPRRILNGFLSQGPWSVHESLGDIVLYQKNAAGKELVSHDVPADIATAPPLLIYDGRLTLLKLDHEKIIMEGQDGVRITFVWRLLTGTDAIYGLKVLVFDDRKKVIWSGVHPLGYFSYPTQDWKEGEAIRETYQFLLPRQARSGSCQVSFALIDFRSGELRPITGGSDGVPGKDWIFVSL